ncbi:acyl-CoA synthetase [Congregibacter variabilis]|uniref:Acyl-CoA synthetase n=1 Tax=Congregibacter variabilis TaxID=3081200 RepID=A0ABZ0I4P9_9GAMM|nr:acyl-CoA synthetase [Congregibacter sp. IMCC43200]
MSLSYFSELRDDNNKIALVESDQAFSYAQLNHRANCIATGLLAGSSDLAEERIAFFLPASMDYVATMHGVWRAGGIAVPLNVASAVTELEHYLGSASVTRLIAGPEHRESLVDLCAQLKIELLDVTDVLNGDIVQLPAIAPGRRAMILFTSGTTSKPKGVVSTHKTIQAQISTLVKAWAWSSDDVIPLFLPLHHVHGIINILSCALAAGASVHLYQSFDMPRITRQVAAGTFTVFMAVPTIYVKLIQYFETLDAAALAGICSGFGAMRLNVSGSAACPESLFYRWKELTGQVLLERYGMTEIGMALSNPYNGERRAGHVGQPLPGVEVKLFDEHKVAITDEGSPGEIRVKGDSVFLEYWNNPRATQESFVDGWFATGDVAVLDNGYYRIMGRSSIDIIKSGGYKLSALEIEAVLLTHEAIAEAAVLGVPDDTWGESVLAVVALKEGASLAYDDLKHWCAGKMSSYKIPKAIKIVDSLPRNAMGKVTKSALRAPA